MGKLIDRTGQKFGRLTITIDVGGGVVTAVCDCGVVGTYSKGRVMCGKTSSCGCYQLEVASRLNKSHGMSSTKLNSVYRGIKRRCYSSTCDKYKYYGGRGISMCEEWRDNFESFVSFAYSNGYKEGLHIDRIDNDGNYEPSNCQFITPSENCAPGKRGIRSDNRSGTTGVRETKFGTWVARCTINKVNKQATFKTFEEAVNYREKLVKCQ